MVPACSHALFYCNEHNSLFLVLCFVCRSKVHKHVYHFTNQKKVTFFLKLVTSTITFFILYIYYWRCIFTFLSNVIGYRRLECLSLYQIMLLFFFLFIRFHFENSFMTQTPSLHLCLLLDAFVNGYTEMKNNSIFITV